MHACHTQTCARTRARTLPPLARAQRSHLLGVLSRLVLNEAVAFRETNTSIDHQLGVRYLSVRSEDLLQVGLRHMPREVAHVKPRGLGGRHGDR